MVPESSSVWWPALGAAEHGQEKAFTSREPLVYEFGKSKRFTNERAPFSYMRTPGGQLLQDDWLGKLQSPPDFCRWNLWGGCMDGMILPNKIRYLQHFRVKRDGCGGLAREVVVCDGHAVCSLLSIFLVIIAQKMRPPSCDRKVAIIW